MGGGRGKLNVLLQQPGGMSPSLAHGRSTGAADGDDVMADVSQAEQQEPLPDAAAATPAGGKAMAPGAGGAAGGGSSAKERQRARMQLKQALRVKVAGLKGNRARLTKLPGNKQQRRSLNADIKRLMGEQAGITNAAQPPAGA